jgi:indolepyruvate ferredoxin oxidoreductase alpha subunit
LLEAIGVKNIRVVNPFDPEECIQVLREETAKEELSVIITDKACIFADKSVIKEPYYVDVTNCSGCTLCTRLGCPAILWNKAERRAYIDESLCTGCDLCVKVCKFNAIHQRRG